MIRDRSALNRPNNLPSKFSLKDHGPSSRSHSRTPSVTRKKERKKQERRKTDRSVGHDFTDHPVYMLARLERWVELSYLRARAFRYIGSGRERGREGEREYVCV